MPQPRKPRPLLKRAAVVLGATVLGAGLGAAYGRHAVFKPRDPRAQVLVQRKIAEAKAGSKSAQAELSEWKHAAGVQVGTIGGLVGASFGLGLTRKRRKK